MSTFKTMIPVDVERVKALLPAGSYIESVSWNGQEIELVWNNRNLVTPFSFPLEYPAEALAQGANPAGVKVREAAPAAARPAEPAPAAAEPVRTPQPKAIGRRTRGVIRQQAT